MAAVTTSDLLASHAEGPVPSGTIRGRCQLCGRETDRGLPAVYPPTFTAGHYLQDGDCWCPPCALMFRDQRFRRWSWMVNRERFVRLTKENAREMLVSPLEPPFAVYLSGGKRQGFLALNHQVNYNREFYVAMWDFEAVPVKRERLEELAPRADELLKLGITKSQLASGRLSLSTVQRVPNARAVLREVESLAMEPEWRLAVWFSPVKPGRLPKRPRDQRFIK